MYLRIVFVVTIEKYTPPSRYIDESFLKSTYNIQISMPINETRTKVANTKEQYKKWKLRSHTKPAVWIDGGSHAREWIAPAVASWMIHNLVEGEKESGMSFSLMLTVFIILQIIGFSSIFGEKLKRNKYL